MTQLFEPAVIYIFHRSVTQWNSWDTPEEVSVLGSGPVLQCCSVSPPSSMLLWAGECVWECSVFSFDGLKNLTFMRWTTWISSHLGHVPLITDLHNQPSLSDLWAFWPLFRNVFTHWGKAAGCQLVLMVFCPLVSYWLNPESSQSRPSDKMQFLWHNCCRIDGCSSACVTKDHRIDAIKHLVWILCTCALKVFYGEDWSL